MITPIKTMTINQIVERKDDLLMSDDDIKELARNVRNKAISEFAERMCDRSCEESFRAVINGIPYDILTQDAVADLAWEIEKELRGGAE